MTRFDMLSPRWLDWCERIANEVRYDSHADADDVGQIMNTMLALGFTIIPPAEPIVKR